MSEWEPAKDDEIASFTENQTWDLDQLVELQKSKCALYNKWVYQLKEENDDTRRYKARLVVKGFQQREGIDFNEIFSHIVKLTTLNLCSILWQQRIYIWNN